MITTQPTHDSDFKHDLSRIGEGAGAVSAGVKDIAHSAIDAAHSGAAELRHGAHNAIDSAKHKLEAAEHSAADAVHSLKELIVRNPATSIGIAAGVGVILGLFLFRPRS